MRRILLVVGIALVVGSAGVAHAVTFTVNSTLDVGDANPGDGICATPAGDCTLAAAVDETNALPGPDTVIVPAGTYFLIIGLPIKDDLELIGSGPATTILDGSGRDTVIKIDDPGIVLIRGVTLQNGVGGLFLYQGGAVLDASIVRGNEGYGVATNSYTSLTVTDSTITGNHGTGATTSIYDAISLVRTVVSDNDPGGGLFVGSTLASIDQSAIINNTHVGDGGGIYALSFGGTLRIVNSTISGNTATGSGGGIAFLTDGSFIGLRYVTVANNVAETDAGGGLGAGGGVFFMGGGSGLESTIIAGNRGPSGEPSDCAVDNALTMLPVGGNLIESIGSCASDGVIVGIDPMLGPLQDNGGPTPTHALLPGSPAIDSAVAGPATPCPPADQRGVSRPQFAACDLGAYEFACGNGTVDLGESCDDGPANGTPGACCSATCAVAPPGTTCADDGSLCTADVCDGSGTCVHPYEPDPNCTLPSPGGGVLMIVSRPAPPVPDQVQFKWSKGPAVPPADFGAPGGGTGYELCVYDATPSGPVPAYQGRPVGQCNTEPCWSALPIGWAFKSQSGVPDGITRMMLVASPTPGLAKLQVKAKGVLTLGSLPLQMSPNVVAQVRTSAGKCWGATFSTAQRNATRLFLGRSD